MAAETWTLISDEELH